MNKMIAYCGLNCEKCDAYIATINNDQELRKKTAKLWAELKVLKQFFAIVYVAFENVR